MRVIFVGHACHLVEIDGLRVLTDPWLSDPAFGGRVTHEPPLPASLEDLGRIDVVALTHGHLDHFHAPTLARMDRSVPVVHPPVTFTELDANLRRLGFTNLHPRRDWEPFRIGTVEVVPTPSLGVLDECAYLVSGRGGRFWNGADAPQPPQVVAEIARRFAPVDLAALSHNSFDQPALLQLPSFKSADHGPQGAARAARTLDAAYAYAAASNLRWRGPDAERVTRKVIRRGPADLEAALAAEGAGTRFLDLRPGDAWSREGGIERRVLRGAPPADTGEDYIHPFLGTGERWSPPGEPSVEDTFRRDLPRRLRAAPQIAAYVGQRAVFEIEGEDAAVFTVDFTDPAAAPEKGDAGAAFAVRVTDRDWKGLFERRLSWQVLLMSDRLAVRRVRPGPPPHGLHFVYALQAVFP